MMDDKIKIIEVWEKSSRHLTKWIDRGDYYEFVSGFTYAPDAYPEITIKYEHTNSRMKRSMGRFLTD